MKIILGIGNPDEKYAGTRHNIGWMVLDELCGKMKKKFQKAGFEFWAAEGRLGRDEAVLVKTWTYVNNTGRVVPELRSRWGDLGEEFMVVCDDVALPLGSVRIRKSGSSGGHNGLKSIIEALGHENFPRMRLGVGGGRPDPEYVLGRFRKDERPVVEETIKTAGEALECWAGAGIEKAMSQFNRVVKPEESK
ncbi:MAG: aminoacyl-tRNA hydrolase [Planctomycetes bacterium]|nr:aminoacyl-tRNA hydrolase [Planctomycetota bacterium]